jgi:hypothetical protein
MRQVRNVRIASNEAGETAGLIKFPKSVVFISVIQIALLRD